MDVFFPFIHQKKIQKEEMIPVFLYIEEEYFPQEKPEEKEEERVTVIEM